jgi:hypothetical protein
MQVRRAAAKEKGAMRYMLLIYGNEAADASATPEQQQEVFADHAAYTEELRAAGAELGGDALHPTSTATSVRVRDGKTLTTHGPFAETAEQLGGFYLVECANLDEALAWAAKNPGAKTGTIEVRPVWEF